MKIRRIKGKTPLAKKFADASASIESEVEFRKLMVVEELLKNMKREGITRTELAKRMDVGPSRITALLNGNNNLTIETLVRAGRAVGADLQQTFVPRGQLGHWVKTGKVRKNDSGCITVDFRPVKTTQAPSPKLDNTQYAEHDAEDAA